VSRVRGLEEQRRDSVCADGRLAHTEDSLFVGTLVATLSSLIRRAGTRPSLGRRIGRGWLAVDGAHTPTQHSFFFLLLRRLAGSVQATTARKRPTVHGNQVRCSLVTCCRGQEHFSRCSFDRRTCGLHLRSVHRSARRSTCMDRICHATTASCVQPSRRMHARAQA
jgi:hypothetical protein